jgi:nitrogen regulatory protein P-II 1
MGVTLAIGSHSTHMRGSQQGGHVKLVIGIVRPDRANAVMEALFRADIRGYSVSRIQGHGGEREQVETYRGTTVMMSLSPKVRFEVAVSEAFLKRTVEAIREGARTDEVGDGKIFVLEMAEAVRIRTGEKDEGAITPVDS